MVLEPPKADKSLTRIGQVKCHLHLDRGCQGKLVTRRSIYGAIQTNCELAWTEGIKLKYEEGSRHIRIPLNLWPKVVS